TGTKNVRFGSETLKTNTWDRTQLLAKNFIIGPALIEEHASTTVLHPSDTLTVDDFGNLKINIGGDAL
ncbi:MAG: hypothetical protein VX156_00875, partial [Pseudomonadota bacterium]|nr:hypothetical protein [Pseudomonadota bacterium]